MPTHLLDVDDLTTEELTAVLDRAAEIKADGADSPLDQQTLGMIFEKPSTRTRVSFETGMTQLGGHAVFLGPDDIHLGHGEPVKDTSRALSRYVDFVMARVFDHADVEELAAYADVPVINALTDEAHPCQTLADLLTIREQFGDFDVSVAWVGDGNNVCQSFVLGAAMTGIDLTVATPEGYEVDDDVLERAADFDNAPETTHDPGAAVADADLVYTDVFVSMGQEDRREAKLADFEGFQVTADLLGDRPLMHCLPAHRGEEVTDEVVESDNAIVWDQAENRLHAQKGLLVWLADQ
ncbi:ornithine carbamoyltransferase [Haloarcula halophila]|uniref:ornithine carbamoyltransferase n=1 Tax=Haloarcula TaxID=2237 RepID=UPI0023E3972F|nr:ornithine carbamoyltransferase [Halomicroarcula sp. DFY41]